ncbi:hypothetical protein M409DRAFT_37833 [Zasmidium cellare ATCC 36951]|uniref:Major facilitator superfamily (MFS) profile domain-containing protein n=1 Tax=Zasmidium cellare ATCC 36951 TaxID=1080233 RepID=A0A6A6BZ14_ZASCE|nr:uncharacterized protein M409DRAFT_37833 [Zasmidium cellare ATCC 36951]KAF2159955.1 hypothetical protein M409DRAFT_37833 [Zasmidium cellare ATCC 36951]
MAGQHLEDVHFSDEKEDHTISTTQQESGRITGWLIGLLLLVAIIPFICNFDISFTGVSLALPSFNNTFGKKSTVSATGAKSCSLTTTQQALIYIPYLFNAIGGGLAGLIGKYIGRRGCITVGSAFTIIGASAILGVQSELSHLIISKCVSGTGLGMLLAVGITYGAESTSAEKRDMLLALFNVGLCLGNMTTGAMAVGTSNFPDTDDWQWKTMVAVQIPLGVLLGSGIWLFPGSPRWLVEKGKDEKAREAFSKFSGEGVHSEAITRRIQNIHYHLTAGREEQNQTTWLDLYRGTDLRRTLISGFLLTGLALCGTQFVVPYTALFLKDLHIANTWINNVIVASCVTGGSIVSPFVIGYFGCRKSLICGYGIMATSMILFSAVSTALGSGHHTAQIILVVCFCIWTFTLGASVGACVFQSSVDMHTGRLRTYGQASTTITYQLLAFASGFWTPYMLGVNYGDMGTNVGYFYFGVDFVLMVIAFLVVPETSGLSLEEMDDYFESGKAAWTTSYQRNKRIHVE